MNISTAAARDRKARHMRNTALVLLLVLWGALPIIGIISGLAMVPVLIAIILLLLALSPPKDILHAATHLRHWRWLLAILLPPLLACFWSLTPEKAIFVWAQFAGVICLGFLGLQLLRAPAFAMTFLAAHSASKLLSSSVAGIMLACTCATSAALWHTGPIIWLLDALRSDPADAFEIADMNRGATILALYSWPVVWMAWQQQKRWLAALLPLPILATVLLLESNAAIVALAIGIGVFWAGILLPRITQWCIALGTPACMLMILWIFPLIGSPTHPTALFETLPKSAQHRLVIWDFTANRIAEKPILGWGTYSTRSIPGGTDTYEPTLAYLPMHTHNMVLQITLEMGYAGLLYFAALAALALWRWRAHIYANASKQHSTACDTALIAGFFIITLVGYGLWQPWWWATACLIALFMRTAHSVYFSSAER